MSPLQHHVERGRAPLTAPEVRRLQAELETNEADVVFRTGLSRTPIFRAAAGLPIQSGTRAALRSTVLAPL